MKNIPTPKLNKKEQKDGTLLYPYYAGYSYSFIDSILKNFSGQNIKILDPWSGTGLTSIVAKKYSLESVGLDINPVLTIVAKANNISKITSLSIRALKYRIIESVRITKPVKHEESINEPLDLWFTESTASNIRNIEDVIYRLLVNENGRKRLIVDESAISDIACFFYVGLFKTTKHLVKTSFSTSNPTWIKTAKSDTDRLELDQEVVIDVFSNEIDKMLSIIDNSNVFINDKISVEFMTGDSTNLPLKPNSIDMVLTSPPYCTRIDYAISTRPELAILGLAEGSCFKELRNNIIGTTTINKSTNVSNELWGRRCLDFLNEVGQHESQGSKNYYLKNYLQYFNSMYSSFSEISRVCKKGALVGIVAQDSYYKQLHNNLPAFFDDMFENLGFEIVDNIEFKTNSFNNLKNKVENNINKSAPVEHFLTYRKS